MNPEQLLYAIDNACPNYKGLSMNERRFVINLWKAREKSKEPSEAQLAWLKKIHERVCPEKGTKDA